MGNVRIGACLIAGACVAGCSFDFGRYDPVAQGTEGPDGSAGNLSDGGAGGHAAASGGVGAGGKAVGGSAGSAASADASAGNSGSGAQAGAAGSSGAGAAGVVGGTGGATDSGPDASYDAVDDRVLPDVQDTGAADVPIACADQGGRTWSQNGHCYFPLGTARGWTAQRDGCGAVGAHLVTIGSAAEQSFALTIGPAASRWIGLTNSVGGRWSWVTGEPLGYTNWGASAPSPAPNVCARMRSSDSTWADRACSSTYAAICERE